MSAFTSPILIELAGRGQSLQRIALSGASGQYSEDGFKISCFATQTHFRYVRLTHTRVT